MTNRDKDVDIQGVKSPDNAHTRAHRVAEKDAASTNRSTGSAGALEAAASTEVETALTTRTEGQGDGEGMSRQRSSQIHATAVDSQDSTLGATDSQSETPAVSSSVPKVGHIPQSFQGGSGTAGVGGAVGGLEDRGGVPNANAKETPPPQQHAKTPTISTTHKDPAADELPRSVNSDVLSTERRFPSAFAEHHSEQSQAFADTCVCGHRRDAHFRGVAEECAQCLCQGFVDAEMGPLGQEVPKLPRAARLSEQVKQVLETAQKNQVLLDALTTKLADLMHRYSVLRMENQVLRDLVKGMKG